MQLYNHFALAQLYTYCTFVHVRSGIAVPPPFGRRHGCTPQWTAFAPLLRPGEPTGRSRVRAGRHALHNPLWARYASFTQLTAAWEWPRCQAAASWAHAPRTYLRRFPEANTTRPCVTTISNGAARSVEKSNARLTPRRPATPRPFAQHTHIHQFVSRTQKARARVGFRRQPPLIDAGY